MRIDKAVFPIQKLPLSKKTPQWGIACVDGIIGREGSGFVGGIERKSRMVTNYGLYNSDYNEEDLKYVTNPFRVEDGFPAKMQDFNIIRPKIDLLIGEESKRPFEFKVLQTNDDGVTKVQDEKASLLKQYIYSYLGIDPNQQDQQQQPKTPSLEEVEKYIKYNYKTIAEETAYHTLNYLMEKLNLKNEFLRGWKDALIAGEELYYVGTMNGEPFVERVNPVACDYDKDPDLQFIEQGDWFLRRMMMSPATIYDRYFDMMTEDDLDRMLSYTNARPSYVGGPDTVNNSSIMYREKFTSKLFGGQNVFDADGNLLTVYHAVWRSYKKVGFLKITNPETGEETETLVDETYKASEGEELTWEWLPEVWEGYRIADDIYIGIGPIEYQHTSIDTPSSRKLPYCGSIYSNSNSRSKSLASIMKPLQYMYIILWYRLETALARDKGKVITMDITQIPKGLGISVEQWMHYIGALGVNFVNPYDEGWDIPGREGGRPSAMNQISALDLSMSNVIAEYINLMAKIEDMIGEISGVTKQRQGSIEQRELVGNVQRSVIQSSHITEPLFWVHNQTKRNVLTAILDVAKYTWQNSQPKKLHYLLNDATRIFMDITEDFLYAELDVFVSDSTQESQNLEALRSLLQPAMSSGATLLDAAEVLTSSNLSEIKNKLTEIDVKKAQMVEAQQQAAAEQQQIELDFKNRELEQKETDSLRKADTSIQVALIQASSSMQGQEPDGDETEGGENMELKKLELQAEKIRTDSELKASQHREEMRKNRKAESQKDQELAIRRIQANKKPTTSK